MDAWPKALVVWVVRAGADGLRLHAAHARKWSPTTIPMKPTNRQTLALNGKIDRYFVVPTVAVYFVLVPDAGRRARPSISWAISPCPPFS